MKSKIIIFFFLITFILFSCNSNRNSNSSSNQTDIIKNYDSELHVFKEYGISIKTPCVLKDVSSQAHSDFDQNYGGIDNEYDKDKMAAYQFIVVKLPIGYKNLSQSTLEKKVDTILKGLAQTFQNSKSIRFGYENYPGYVVETIHNEYNQKGIFFHRENFIYGLTIISNDNLEGRFNKLTNNIDFFEIEQSLNSAPKAESKRIELGRKYENRDFYISYPDSWEIVKEGNKVSNTTIALQVMQKRVNDYDFASNVNIIVSSQKLTETTSQLSEISFNQIKNYFNDVKLISKNNDVEISTGKGTLTHYLYELQGYHLGAKQYIVKKADNSTYTITGTYDADNKAVNSKEIDKIIQSIVLF